MINLVLGDYMWRGKVEWNVEDYLENNFNGPGKYLNTGNRKGYVLKKSL